MASHRYWRVLCHSFESRAFSEATISEIEMAATAGGADQCSGGTSSASNGTSHANAFDNNVNTYHSFGGNFFDQWITYDFGSATTVREVRITARENASAARQCVMNLTIQGSDNNSTWSTFDTYLDNVWTTSEQKTFAVAASARPSSGDKIFWRLAITANDGGVNTGIREIEMATSLGGGNQCTGGSAGAKSIFGTGFRAADAFDGGTDEWVSDDIATPTWIVYKFTSAKAIIEARVTARGAPANSQAPRDFVIQSSSDFITWTDELTVTGSTGWTGAETRTYTWSNEVIGDLAVTLGAVSLAATGEVPVGGNADEVLGSLSLFATGLVGDGVVGGLGDLSIVLDDVTVDAAGTLAAVGSASVLLGDVALAGFAVSGSSGPFARRRLIILN